MATESLSAEGLRFIEKYFKENDFALTRHHIDSYEQCIFEEIPSIIRSSNPIVFLKEPIDKAAGIFGTRVEIFIGGDGPQAAITVSPPVVSLDGGNTMRRLLPNEARLRNLTYAAQFNVDLLFRFTFTKPREGMPGIYDTEVRDAPLVKDFPMFRIPVLLRSCLCPTGVQDPVRLEEMGECRNDYGGYFIVGGAEKVLVTREEQAFNSLYVEKKKPGDTHLAYSSVVSLHPETKQTRRVALYMMKGGEIRVAIPMVRGAFPLFILFRAMGLESDQEIVRMIFPEVSVLEDELRPSIEDAYPIYNRFTAIQYIMTLTKGFTEAHVLDILWNLMLPHVPDEPLARAQYLAEMARETIRANLGLRDKTDRDDMRNKRFLTTGTLVRELFNGCWKDWRAEMVLKIDRTYRSNEEIYRGVSVLDLFRPELLGELFQPAVLNNYIMRGYRGKWGTNEFNTKSGVLQPLARISYLDATSHIRRVVADFDSGQKTTGPRKLHTSQIGYFCTSETPQGAHIGITKNMSIMTQFSIGTPIQPVYDWMKMKGGLIPVGETTAALRAQATVVQINGGTVGFTMKPRELTSVLKLLKWNACLSPTASVSFNTTEKVLRLYLDEGRPLRPLWHLNGEGAAFLDRVPDLLSRPWRTLVFGTFPPTATATMRTTAFLDPLAELAAATFGDYEALLRNTAGFIEYCDPMEMNENYISWWGGAEDLTTDHTHAELHPSTMPGLLASMIPFSNHNQAPRNQLSNSQSKQGIGTMVKNIHHRYDTYAHQLCYGEGPLCRTMYYDMIGNGEMPYGFNCIIAATSETGYNQDDGLIVNRDSVARGMFQSLSFRSYDCPEEVDPRTKAHSHVANPGSVPSWTSLRPGLDYSQLDEHGIVREGTYVTDKTVLVGRYLVVPDTNDIKDASVTPGLLTEGRVDSVVVLHQDGKLLVKVRVLKMRLPVLGDKFSSRHGQKGTMGMLVASEDLPRTASGLVPDVMVNPGGLISRMTLAQMIEMIAGRAAAEVACTMNATTFCNDGNYVKQIGDTLEGLGAERTGNEILYSGLTGKQLQAEIYMCPLYFMRLKHLTDDKLNSRGEGRLEIRTHQPTGGRANEGGLRIGEMERDSLCAHGISSFLQESMMKRGDGTTFWICNGCGRIPIYNDAEKLFVCPTCDGPLEYSGLTPETLMLQMPTKQSRVTFSRIAMPYTMKLLDQEMTSIGNMGFRIVTEGAVTKMREGSWTWPAVDIEFKPEERGIEAETVNTEALTAKDEAVEISKEAKKVARRVSKVAGLPVDSKEVVDAVALFKTTVKAALASEKSAAADATRPVIKYSSKVDNEYTGFTNFANTPFTTTGAQIAAPDGTVYPDFGTSVADRTWPTVEHYFQAMKFPQDPDWQEDIRVARTPTVAKQMALDGSHKVRGDWEAIKVRVMKTALMAKFQQHPELLVRLQKTGVAKLVDQTVKGSTVGALLEQIREELKNVPVDEALLAAGPSSVIRSAMNAPGIEEAVEPLVEETAQATVGAAQAVLQEGKGIAGTAGTAVQQGGVYLFINSAMSGQVEAKTRRARAGGSGRRLQWDGMQVSRVQEGGDAGSNDGVEEMTRDSGHSTEVMVEKLG